jgi:hypothetical protein
VPEVFDYAIVRVVPRVERGERINVGVIVHCPTRDWLGCRIADDLARVQVLAPDADLDAIADHLRALERICRGDATAGAIATLPVRERFHWLVHPRSTAIQMSAVHSGRTDDPSVSLDHLFTALVS